MRYLIAGMLALLTACGQSEVGNIESTDSATSAYVVLDKSLQALKDDFNAYVGKARLVFIVGPTCGICLRGMADMNDTFLAELQDDTRLHTFVVHVPVLGAKEKDVAPAMPLLDGPRVTHYWDDTGITGSHYQDTLDIRAYAWDVWLVYGPEARWDDLLPPEPDFWQHQLSGLGTGMRLEPEAMAAQTRKHMEQATAGALAGTPPARPRAELLADGTVIPVVAQPRGVAIEQHIRGRGGYRNLKRIEAVEMQGRLEVGDKQYPLNISASRPQRIKRVIEDGGAESIAEFDGESVVFSGSGEDRGLPAELETTLLSAFEFDGPLVEWKDKGHDSRMLGMEKRGNVLAWQLELQQANGPHWQLLIDSHTGNIVEAALLNSAGAPQWLIVPGDYRDVSGFQFPHRVEYRTAAGDLVATERLDTISVTVEPFELAEQTVVH